MAGGMDLGNGGKGGKKPLDKQCSNKKKRSAPLSGKWKKRN